MITQGSSYEEQLEDYRLTYELLKRKLRTSYVSQLIKSISLPEIRDMHRAIHQGESPRSGLLPGIDAIPQVRESLLYMSLFASLYRNASRVDIRTEMDVHPRYTMKIGTFYMLQSRTFYFLLLLDKYMHIDYVG